MNNWLIGFLVIAAVAVVLAIDGLTDFVVGNRRVRVARHESFRTYYRGLAFSH